MIARPWRKPSSGCSILGRNAPSQASMAWHLPGQGRPSRGELAALASIGAVINNSDRPVRWEPVALGADAMPLRPSNFGADDATNHTNLAGTGESVQGESGVRHFPVSVGRNHFPPETCDDLAGRGLLGRKRQLCFRRGDL
jgi:hypothetical protein